VAQNPWRGLERRQHEWPWLKAERRREQAGYPVDAGVNAEEPMDEQEERELAQERGPDPRIPK